MAVDPDKAEEREVLAVLLKHALNAGRALFVAEIADHLGWPPQQAATVLARLALRGEIVPAGALVADPKKRARVLATAPQAVQYYIHALTQQRHAVVRVNRAGARESVMRALTACAMSAGSKIPRPRGASWIAAELMYSQFPLDPDQVTKILEHLVATGRVVEIDNPRQPHYLPATMAHLLEPTGVTDATTHVG